MSDRVDTGPLQLGERAPNFVLDAITREGKIAIDDFRGEKPVLVGLYRGPALSLLQASYRDDFAAHTSPQREGHRKPDSGEHAHRAVAALSSVSSDVGLLAAADPERASHRAFGLPNLQIIEGESALPHKVSMSDVKSMRLNVPGEMPEPMDPFATLEYLNKKDNYDIAEADQQMIATGVGQLVGQFLLDRDGVVRWTFSEVLDGGLGAFPNSEAMMSAASRIGR